jgi:hypothetical protein
MFKQVRYKLLGKGDSSDEDDGLNWDNLTPRERLRLHVGGFLFIGLGIYIIWRTVLLVAWLFKPHAMMDSRISWPDARYLFVL